MFGILGNLVEGAAKVAVGVVVAPVALAVDVVTLPVSAEDPNPNHGPFDRTAGAIKLVANGVETATKVD